MKIRDEKVLQAELDDLRCSRGNPECTCASCQSYRVITEAIQSLRAEVTKRHEANRWNVYPDGDALRVCLGDHEKHEDCTFVRYVPESEVTKLRADVQELESDLSVSAKSEKHLYDRVDTLTRCILTEIAYLEHNQRGSTHWAGCESRHRDCAAIKRMDAAINAARGAT